MLVSVVSVVLRRADICGDRGRLCDHGVHRSFRYAYVNSNSSGTRPPSNTWDLSTRETKARAACRDYDLKECVESRKALRPGTLQYLFLRLSALLLSAPSFIFIFAACRL